MRFGKFNAVLEPGLHFFLPLWIDRVVGESVVVETMQIKPQSLTTKDGKTVVITAVVTFRIEDIRTFLLDVEGRNNVVEDSSYGSIASFVMKRTWDELVGLDDLGNELTKSVRRLAKRYGVDIISVQLIDFIQCRPLRLITSSEGHHMLPQGGP